MVWILTLILGALIGTLATAVTGRAGMPPSLTLGLAIAGAFFGTLLAKITGFKALAELTPYFMATVVVFGFLVGGTLAFSIVHKRNSRE